MAVPNNSGGKRPASRATSRLAGVSHTTVSFVVNNVVTANIIRRRRGRACMSHIAQLDYHPLHQPAVSRLPAGERRAHQHGRQRPCLGQHVHRAALTDHQIRGGVYPRIRNGQGGAARLDLLPLFPIYSITTSAHTSLSATGRHKRHATI